MEVKSINYEQEISMVRIIVRLNGTNKNPYHALGFRCNPFPQVAKTELMALQQRLNELGGDPIKDENDLRNRLKGFEPAFIEGCVQRFKPGEMVTFTIEFPE
jgi:hypothetical protein